MWCLTYAWPLRVVSGESFRYRRRAALPAALRRADKSYAFALAVSSIPKAFMTARVVLSVGFPRSLNER